MRPIISALPRSSQRLSPVARAITLLGVLLFGECALVSHALADDATDPDGLPAVAVSAPVHHSSQASIAGLGDAPAWSQPLQAESWDDHTLQAAQIQRLSDVTKLDASLSDFYNAAGYWDFLTIRGYVVDLTHNYRREGLPIYAETSLPLDNKAAVEVLKGTSGMQAGQSSPGGLINLLVKRPTGHVRDVTVALTGGNSVLAAADVGERFGDTQQFGLRLNAAHEHLNPSIHDLDGERHLLALAGDWRLSPDTLIEAEFEHSRRSQRSVPGFSMTGSTVPSAKDIDPDTNLNNQSWAQPVVMTGSTGTLRWTQALPAGWRLQSTYGRQRLVSDDRAAFPFASPDCYTTGSDCDRFSADGSFNYFDYRSNHEVRTLDALDAHVDGAFNTSALHHDLSGGVMRSLARTDVPTAAYGYAGTGNIYEDLSVPANPEVNTPQNVRRERTTEFYLRDNVRLSEAWQAWLGVRHTMLARAQWLSDGSQTASNLNEQFTTPWLALGYTFAPQTQVYASWGEGVEVLPAKLNVPYTVYTNNGEVLPAQKSRQWELGVKGQSARQSWSVALFHIVRPQASAIYQGTDASYNSIYTYQLDGDARHQGIEGQWRGRVRDAWSVDLSAMVMDAERRGSANTAINGKAPTNVPDYAIKWGNTWRVPMLANLSLQGDVVHEGPRTVDAANDVRISAWTRLDVSAALQQRLQGDRVLTWRLGVTNLLDTRAWKESPTQFDHIYLIPMARRTVTASATFSL